MEELFPVLRYDEEATKEGNREEENLESLRERIEIRKRKYESGESLLRAGKKSKGLLKNSNEDDSSEKKVSNSDLLHISGENENPLEANPVLDEIAEKEGEGFQILGTDVFDKKQKVEMVLPPWLAYPTIISNNISKEDIEMHIENLKYINPEIKKNLKLMKMEKLFPVQSSVIPWILESHSKPSPFRPRDICVSAPTGSGKTLAFAIPIVQLLLNRVEQKIRALIVLPVNELALQVFKVFRQLLEKTNLSICLLSATNPFASEQAQLVECYKGIYYSKVDIVVTTPGRLVEHLHSTKGFCLKSLRFLVIDEADRIMEQIYHNWLYHLDSLVKSTSDMFFSGRSIPLCMHELGNNAVYQPHKMLFSATLSQDPEKLENLHLFQPKLFTSVVQKREELLENLSKQALLNGAKEEIRGEFVGKYTTPSELTENYCVTESRLKPLTLYSLITENNWKKFLCFTNSSDGAHRLSFVLRHLFGKDSAIQELSSTLKPHIRSTILQKFARGGLRGVVCSDALARGIDIPDVDIVISYDSPRHITTYIHRVGRTARAGRPGIAVTLLAPNELQNFQNILSEAGKDSIDEIKVKTAIEENNAKRYSQALLFLQKAIESEKKVQVIRKKMDKHKAIDVKPITEGMSVMDKLQAELAAKTTGGENALKFTNENKKVKKNKKRKNKPNKTS